MIVVFVTDSFRTTATQPHLAGRWAQRCVLDYSNNQLRIKRLDGRAGDFLEPPL